LIALPAATHPIDWKDGQSMIISERVGLLGESELAFTHDGQCTPRSDGMQQPPHEGFPLVSWNGRPFVVARAVVVGIVSPAS
jgi:hypothetical protein